MHAPLVLIVDPDPDTRAILAAFLTHAGFEVDVESAGASVPSRAAARRPAAIVGEHPIRLDDGRLLCTVLREDPATRDIPFVALTANALPSQVSDAMITHDVVFVKPPDFMRLVAAVTDLVGRSLPNGPRAGPPGMQ